MSMIDDIRAGKYEAKGYPQRPVEPKVMRVPAKNLSDAEIASLPGEVAAYRVAKVAYENAMATYRTEHSRLLKEFRADLEEEFGTAGHEKAEALYNLAWDHGHSSGLSDVYYAYAEMSVLLTK